jgi:hypothetical protein
MVTGGCNAKRLLHATPLRGHDHSGTLPNAQDQKREEISIKSTNLAPVFWILMLDVRRVPRILASPERIF